MPDSVLKKVKNALRFFYSLEIIVILLISILFISGFLIFSLSGVAESGFSVQEVSFVLGQDARKLEFSVSSEGGSYELKEVFVNGNSVTNWLTDKRVISKNESAFCVLNYHWNMDKFYTIKVATVDDRFAEVVAKSPEIAPDLKMDVLDMNTEVESESIKVNFDYLLQSNGTDMLRSLLFSYLYFHDQNRSLYIFYDFGLMPHLSLVRADYIVNQFEIYGANVTRVNYNELYSLSEERSKIILMVVGPLKDNQGNRVEDALPGCLIDPDEDGFVRDDSSYNKSPLYDWMIDDGLILITVGSVQPHKQLVYGDGSVITNRDLVSQFDAHIFLTDASGERSLINGGFSLGTFDASRISGSLDLATRSDSFAFDKNALEDYGLDYYSYGDYRLVLGEDVVNLSLPLFIRVGKGGWLAMGDKSYFISNNEMASDLFYVCTQAVWDSYWIPYGWYWDNGAHFATSNGSLNLTSSIGTEYMPLSLLPEKLTFRLVTLGHQYDKDQGVINEWMTEQPIKTP